MVACAEQPLEVLVPFAAGQVPAVGVGEALGVAVAFQDDVGQVDDGPVAAFLERLPCRSQTTSFTGVPIRPRVLPAGPPGVPWPSGDVVPASPSICKTVPSGSDRIAAGLAVTQGTPSSRATIAACDSGPPQVDRMAAGLRSRARMAAGPMFPKTRTAPSAPAPGSWPSSLRMWMSGPGQGRARRGCPPRNGSGAGCRPRPRCAVGGERAGLEEVGWRRRV